jgi:hypothetical protein
VRLDHSPEGQELREASMNRERLALLGVLILIGVASAADEPPAEKIDAKLLALHRDEAKRWEIFVDADRTEKAELVPEPIYRWTNASRANGQSGAMFVWMYRARPVAVGGVFSNPEGDRRVIMHEFHALGPLKLFAHLGGSDHEWLPLASVPMLPLPEAAPPESAARRRDLQARDLARSFTARTVDDLGGRWQLRLLPRPLYRYPSAEGKPSDGFIFGFISDAGTDPEVILVLEVAKDAEREAWHYRTVRLSISSLYVQYKGKGIWTSLREDPKGPLGNGDNTYKLLRDRLIDELPELARRRHDRP